MGIDVIGDVHGHADELAALLKLLGYVERAGAYRHPTNTALFLGDLIDRGPRQLECVRIPRMMRDAGSARILMGNHEFNAIAYATPTDEALDRHLRPRTQKNTAQHAAFLGAVGVDSAEHRDAVAFFRTLPLWEEIDGLRGVHACWSVQAMDDLAASINGDRTLTSEGLVATSTKGSKEYKAAETLLKGPEVDLPDGLSFLDKDGHVRRSARTRWWDCEATSYATAAWLGTDEPSSLPDLPLPSSHIFPDDGGQPIFFGHYWLSGEPRLTSPRRACLDFSVARGGALCAYTWDREAVLDPERLTSVRCR